MVGEVAGFGAVSVGIVTAAIGGVAAASLVVGVFDVLRHPTWAWRRAGCHRIPSLLLVAGLPFIGMMIYVFTARPRVTAERSRGRAIVLPFGVAKSVGPLHNRWTFGARPVNQAIRAVVDPARSGPLRTFGPPSSFGSFGTAPASDDIPVRTAEATPVTRLSVVAAHPAAGDQSFTPITLCPGWKADPTGRHQFRYWDGSHWTGSVAKSGVLTSDPTAS